MFQVSTQLRKSFSGFATSKNPTNQVFRFPNLKTCKLGCEVAQLHETMQLSCKVARATPKLKKKRNLTQLSLSRKYLGGGVEDVYLCVTRNSVNLVFFTSKPWITEPLLQFLFYGGIQDYIFHTMWVYCLRRLDCFLEV